MKKDIAIFTTTKDEKYFLKKWIEYYKNFFDPSDIYVLDHESEDGSTDNLDVHVKKIINNNTLDIPWVTEQVVLFSKELLDNYKYFFHVDVDEFIITKDGTNLKTYLYDQFNKNKNCLICTGYNLIHNYTVETNPFDTSLPILSQRKFIKRIIQFDKPIIANYVLDYHVGEHVAGNEIPYSSELRGDPNLLMIHAKRYDRDECINRLKARYVTIKHDKQDPERDQCINIKTNIDKFLYENFNFGEHPTLSPIDSILSYDYKNLF